MASKEVRAAQAAVRELGLVLRVMGGGSLDREFEVRFRGQKGDGPSYFTNDAQDAVDTARAMAAWQAKQAQA